LQANDPVEVSSDVSVGPHSDLVGDDVVELLAKEVGREGGLEEDVLAVLQADDPVLVGSDVSVGTGGDLVGDDVMELLARREGKREGGMDGLCGERMFFLES